MAIDIDSSSPHILPADISSDPALSYSRHYAKKIHDLGKSSRETWIQTLVDHVLHGPNPTRGNQRVGTTSKRQLQSERSFDSNENSPNMSRRRKEPGGAFDLAGATSRRDGRIMNSLHNSPYQPKLKIQQEAPVYLRKIVSTREGYRETPRKSRDGQGTARDNDDANSTTSSYKAHHYPPIKNSMFKDQKLKFIPQELAASPYVSQRQNYRIVPIEKVLVRQKTSRPKTRPTTRRKQDARTGTGNQRSSNPYLASAPAHHAAQHPPEAWRPPPIVTSAQMVAMEKRAREIASKAVKENKIFTCEGPYPVDAYVRFSLRKRGWVEKFAPKIHANLNPGAKGTSSKLECELDEDFDVICDRNIPAPWEEDHGVYATMSRLVRHRPARFIWAGRAVNSMTLHQDVIVNHFPKARTFSSKTGIANSLRDLPWLASSDPMDFFPRCYLLSEDEKDDLIEDFRITACISLLKWVMSMFTTEDKPEKRPVPPDRSKTIEIIHEEKTEQAVMGPTAPQQQDAIPEKDQSEDADTSRDQQDPAVDQSEEPKPAIEEEPSRDAVAQPEVEADDLENNNLADDDLGEDTGDYTDDPDFASSSDESDSDDDVVDKVSSPIQMKVGKRTGITIDSEFDHNQKVRPVITLQERVGGEVPSKAVDWALSQCERFIRFKTHEDLDVRNKPNLTPAQWDQFLKWYYKVAHDGATVSVTESKVQKAKETLSKMRKLWTQCDIDGMRNLWIIKPGGKSKGIGIEFCNNLEDMMKYIENTTIAGTYVVQKYIETPLLIYKTKFDIRQWFVVTDWNPLTVWFYKGSYLRICSQEFTMDSMHEAIHLSNVAIQQFYLNGDRTGDLPDDNYMDSAQFEKYLASIGEPHAWSQIVYPGMTRAVVNTLLATMDIAENKKAAFELYGADFMLADDFSPWLLEINSSPGMAPSSKEKAKMCASVVEDLMKVVLDRRENKTCETGNFEMVFKDTTLPTGFKTFDNRMFIEGNRIKRTDLQRYASLDSVVKSGEDPSQNEFLKQLRNKQNKAAQQKDSKPAARADVGASRQRTDNRNQQTRGGTKGDNIKEQPALSRSYTKIYGKPQQKQTTKPGASTDRKTAVPTRSSKADQQRDVGGKKKENTASKTVKKAKEIAKAETPEVEDTEEEEEVETEDDEVEKKEGKEETEEEKESEEEEVEEEEEESEEEYETEEEEEETEEEVSEDEEVKVKLDEEVRVRKIDRTDDNQDEHDF